MKRTRIIVKLILSVLMLTVSNYLLFSSIKGNLKYDPIWTYSFMAMMFFIGLFLLLNALDEREKTE
jgi:hypothetical protein